MLLSIDGSGPGHAALAEPGTHAAAARAGRRVRLLSSYELDDAPGFERFFLVAAGESFDVGAILRAARALGSQPSAARHALLPLPTAFAQASLALDKSRRSLPKETP